MRLGDYEGKVPYKDSIAYKTYGENFVERHRHRYEINTYYKQELEKKGLIFSGVSPDDTYMEIAEVPKNTFMVGVQFHPELSSTLFNPNPIISQFTTAV